MMAVVMIGGALIANGCDAKMAQQILSSISQGLMLANMGVMAQIPQPNRGTMVDSQPMQWPYGGFKPEVVGDSTFYTFDDNGNPMRNHEFFFNDGSFLGFGTSVPIKELPGVDRALTQAGDRAVTDYKNNMTPGEGMKNAYTGVKNGVTGFFGNLFGGKKSKEKAAS